MSPDVEDLGEAFEEVFGKDEEKTEPAGHPGEALDPAAAARELARALEDLREINQSLEAEAATDASSVVPAASVAPKEDAAGEEEREREAPVAETAPEGPAPEERARAEPAFASSAQKATGRRDPGESTDELTFTTLPKPDAKLLAPPELDSSRFASSASEVGEGTGVVPPTDFDENTTGILPAPDFAEHEKRAAEGPGAETEPPVPIARETVRRHPEDVAKEEGDDEPLVLEIPEQVQARETVRRPVNAQEETSESAREGVQAQDVAGPNESTPVSLQRSGRGFFLKPEGAEKVPSEPAVSVDDVLEALERRVRDTPAPRPAEPPKAPEQDEASAVAEALEALGEPETPVAEVPGSSEGAAAEATTDAPVEAAAQAPPGQPEGESAASEPAPEGGEPEHVQVVMGVPIPKPGSGDSGGYPLSFIQQSLRENKNPYIEPIDVPEIPKAPNQRAGAIEIARERIRYLELQPAGDRVIAMRFEEIPLESAPSDGSGAWGNLVARALVDLSKRLGGLPPVNILVPQASIGAKVATMSQSTRRIERAVLEKMVNEEAPPAEDATSERRLLRNIRIGEQVWKSVLVTSSRRTQIDWLANVLKSANVGFIRMTTSHLAFLERLVFLAARMDEDAVEAFVYTDPTAVTVAFPARGVLLRSDSYPVSADASPEELADEIATRLDFGWQELKREFGFQEIARIRYLSAWPGAAFPAHEVGEKCGRPTEHMDPEALLRIDLESVEALQVPPDAMAALGAAALDGMVGAGGLDLSSRKIDPGRARVFAWFVDAAAAILVSAAVMASGRAQHEQIDSLESQRLSRNKTIAEQPRLADEKAAILRGKEAREKIERESEALAKLGQGRPDLRALVTELGRRKPGELFVRTARVRRDSRDAPWSLALEAVAVADSGTASGVASAFGESLKTSQLLEGIEARPREGNSGDESSVDVTATLRQAKGGH